MFSCGGDAFVRSEISLRECGGTEHREDQLAIGRSGPAAFLL
ncbi:hypothetical protein SS05631_c30380 [Sinorhizobium sp. CCBAU 05631]|nr:hypothetical protein SS05631_c30380 [Sinorhizobium sp. CCBAU 05631]